MLLSDAGNQRAIWSAPPPVPAGMTNSIGFVGSQAFAVSQKEKMAVVRNNRQTRKIRFSFVTSFVNNVPAIVRLSFAGVQSKYVLH